jgi:hypothetical protein
MSDKIIVEVADGVFKEISWPFCAVSGCKNRCCKSLNSKYCYPHTRYTGIGLISKLIEDTQTERQDHA